MQLQQGHFEQVCHIFVFLIQDFMFLKTDFYIQATDLCLLMTNLQHITCKLCVFHMLESYIDSSQGNFAHIKIPISTSEVNFSLNK